MLIGIHSDHEVGRASILFSLLLDGIERTEAGVARSREDDVRAFSDLCERKFFAFARIVPCRIGDADVILDHADVWINGARPFFVTLGEPVNESDVHAAEKTDRAGARSFGREYPDEIRAFMFLEYERRHVRELAHAVDDRKLNVRIVFRDLLHDRRLCEAHANDEIEVAFREGTHRGFDRVWRSRFNVPQDDRMIFRRALHPLPRRRVERTIVLAADIENDPDAYLRRIL